MFIPVATPVSDGRTASVISVAIDASANPIPAPSTAIGIKISQDRSFQSASDADARASDAIRDRLTADSLFINSSRERSVGRARSGAA